jgi:hypothetical protein
MAEFLTIFALALQRWVVPSRSFLAPKTPVSPAAIADEAEPACRAGMTVTTQGAMMARLWDDSV